MATIVLIKQVQIMSLAKNFIITIVWVDI